MLMYHRDGFKNAVAVAAAGRGRPSPEKYAGRSKSAVLGRHRYSRASVRPATASLRGKDTVMQYMLMVYVNEEQMEAARKTNGNQISAPYMAYLDA
jgi:hypothetical protein